MKVPPKELDPLYLSLRGQGSAALSKLQNLESTATELKRRLKGGQVWL
jgi:hypothetical protein